MRVLIVEDHALMAQVFELMLKSEGFNVYVTGSGEEGENLARIYDYDAILLDLILPDVDGLTVLRHLRAAKISTPVLVVTGDEQVGTMVKAFDLGADDFLTKPVRKAELACRLRAVIRRSKGHMASKLAVGPISVLLNERRAEVNGVCLALTGKEYQLLELLALRRGQTVPREMMLNHLYGGMDEPDIKIIDVFLCKVRRKLADAGAPGLIHTVWGRGYVLRDEAPVVAHAAPVAELA